MPPNESYPQHVVTAVIVAHDGAAWLPHVADALLEQTRPVQRVVAVDTGSRDRSGAVLASKFGQAAVFGMDRATGYGAAIVRALQHRAANVPVPAPPGSQGGERIEWLWLLHDDCEPAPDALEQLLRGTVETTSAAVLGPKLRDWSNREVILEAGVTLDTATRRVTGIEPREVDQGQHDGDRDTLAVSSAGMLVRRDVWETVGGFDPGMALFMEDIDFCWRVHAAGYRVRVITDAIAYHAQGATKHKRAVSVGRRARMLDRRNGLLTLLGNLPLRPMLTAAVGNVLVSLLRITFFLLAKRLAAAMDELTALVAVLCHPIRLIRMRSQRSRGRRAAYSRVRADLPPGHSGRRLAEFTMSTLSKSQPEAGGAHHASADPTEDDSMLVDNGLGKRLLTSPSLLTFIALLAIALAAGRSLIGPGPLGGGSLVPAWGGASDLWSSYLQSFHPAGIGSTAAAPPWLALLAVLATVLAGKAWLAIDVILIGCVPLAGMTAMLAVRKVTSSALVRVWASVTYALLPVAMGVIASGRFGTAVAFILLPLIVAQAGRMVGQSGPRANRAAWATGLLAAVAAAFVPLIWLITFAACLLAAIVFRTTRRGMLRNLAIAALTAPVLLLPWSLTLVSHPADLLLEAGLPQPGTPVSGLPARALMLLSPGGPGLPRYWVTAGLLAVALAALFVGRRRRLITAGWGVALSGLLAAILVSHLTVRPDDGGPVVVWAGLPLALAALGLLMAAAVGADGLGRLLAGVKGWRAILGGRGLWAALLALVGCSAPVLAAVAWLGTGVSGPVHQVSTPVVPELVAIADGQARQVRTLVLRSTGGQISYLLLRGPSPSLADTALTPPPDAQRALNRAVSALTTPDGGLGIDQAQLLANFDIGYVLVQAPVDEQLVNVLDNMSGLHPYSTTAGYSLWQLETPPARVSVTEPDGTVVAIPSGPVGVSAASAPAAGGTLLLAEPAGGWSASVNGQPLAEIPSPAGSWAQAFRLPKGGGSLSLSHSGLSRDLMLVFELLAFLVVAALALPGIHVEQEAQAAGQIPDADVASGQAAGRSAGGARGASAAGSGSRSARSRGAGSRGVGSRGVGSRGVGSRGAVPQGAGVPGAGPGLAEDGGELAAGGAAARQSGLVAAGAGRSQRPARGGRGKAGRGRDRVGRNKADRGSAITAKPGMAAAGIEDAADAAGLPAGAGLAAASGLPAGSARRRRGVVAGRDDAGWRTAGRRRDAGRRDAGRDDSGQDDADQLESRLAKAWPYAAADDRDRADDRYAADDRYVADDQPGERRLPDAWPYAAAGDEPGGRRLPEAWPHAAAGEERGSAGTETRRSEQRSYPASADATAGEPRRGRAGGPPGWASSYFDDLDLEPGNRDELSATGPSGRPFGTSEHDPGGGRHSPAAGRSPSGRSPSGRSPSGRSAAGDWPYPDQDADARLDPLPAEGRSPTGRPPAGGWPYSDAGEPAGDRLPASGDRSPAGAGPASKRSESPWGYEDLTLGDGADGDRAGDDGAGYDSAGYDSAGYDSAGYDSAGYDTPDRQGGRPYGEPGRTQGGSRSRTPDRAAAPDSHDAEPEEQRRGRWGSGRASRHRAVRSGREQQAGTGRPPSARADADWPGGEQPRDDWSRAGRPGDDRRGGDRRALEPPASWSGADDDALEPLPPLDGPGRSQSRRSAWRPADDGARDGARGRADDWGELGSPGDEEGLDQRWSAPAPGYEPYYEPEYDGDSW